ncbi:MAG: FAD-binding protein [Pyrinomonadaceae bacterium]|nr:FAD-binding protein [Pyrinomonadaceae bacterium]
MDDLIEQLRAMLGQDGVLSETSELLVYECDGLPQHKARPRAVVFPRSTEEVADVLRLLARERVPFAPRGAGTGLSGGALALNQGVIIELARMRRLINLDAENRTARVEVGMTNAQVSRCAAPFNLHYVPDPSSGATCTIGGNIAENAGGIHCLKYGMTVDHVLAARVVLASGEIIDLDNMQTPGYDLLGVFIGSEGTFGIATEATLRLTSTPPAVRTLLADFSEVDDGSRAVSAIIAEGLVPAALEMIDGATIRAVEASVFAAGLPLDAGAALLIELDGLEAGLDEEAERAESICREHGARNVRRAADEHERKRFWMARKGAFGAMGRIAPDLMLQDAVVPRSRLPEVLAATYRIGAKYDLRVANVFHAGDGNLHPFICFDSRDAEQVRRVKEAGREMMECCVQAGGTITGEHGVGLDKSEYLPLIFSATDMDAMLRVRAAFDPSGLCNPGKIIPVARSCGEARGARSKAAIRQEESAATHNTVAIADSQKLPLQQTRAPQQNVDSTFAHAIDDVTQTSRNTSIRKIGTFNFDAAHQRLAQIVGAENAKAANDDRKLIIAPASADEAREALRLAHSEGWTIAPMGAGTWRDAGNPYHADLFITTRRLNRIIEHEPADLVATAEAGVPLARFNAELERAGQNSQWLPLDPPDDGRATLGGIVATGIGGAQSVGYGAPRSFVTGMRVLLADGKLVKAGGRVVKNVAGYDLCKLFTGSYGTLCLIIELTFKLQPRPVRETTVIASADSYASLLDGARAVLAANLFPVALEILSPTMSRNINAEADPTAFALLIRFAGNPQTVSYQIERACALLERKTRTIVSEDDANLWRDLAAMPLRFHDKLIWRAVVRPAALGLFLDAASQNGGEAFSASSCWHAGAGDGRLRAINSLPATIEPCIRSLENLRREAQTLGGSLIVENASTDITRIFDAWGDAGDSAELMGRVKAQLDSQNIFSPGRFVSG